MSFNFNYRPYNDFSKEGINGLNVVAAQDHFISIKFADSWMTS